MLIYAKRLLDMDKKALHKALLSWYDKNGRKNLPWRTFGTPLCDERLRGIDAAYGVYISEIMLQQTQVNRVLENFYFPFLHKFPNLQSLANADESEILKAWQGLGYYSRARNLKLCAASCVARFNGHLPENVSELVKLQGIGAYTAGAIACFGYKKAVGFIDGNIKRVFSRLFALANPTQSLLQSKVNELLCEQNAFDYNQALIDLGALVCTPKLARCALCPLDEWCVGKNAPQKYPQSKKVEYERLNLSLFVVRLGDKIALQKSKQNLYKGLYNLPQMQARQGFEFSHKQTRDFEFGNELANARTFDGKGQKFSEKRLEFGEKELKFIGEFKHSYTKYRINARVYELEFDKKSKNLAQNPIFKALNLQECEFTEPKKLSLLPLSKLCVKALQLFSPARLF